MPVFENRMPRLVVDLLGRIVEVPAASEGSDLAAPEVVAAAVDNEETTPVDHPVSTFAPDSIRSPCSYQWFEFGETGRRIPCLRVVVFEEAVAASKTWSGYVLVAACSAAWTRRSWCAIDPEEEQLRRC